MKSKKQRDSKISREFRLPANVMHEEAWEDDGPNMKLARAFIVVLVLHIVAVAGLAAFNLFDNSDSKIGSNTTLPAKPQGAALNNETPPNTPEAKTADGQVNLQGLRAVKVERQMSTALFALQYGLTEPELLELNKQTPLVAGPLLPNETVYVPESAVAKPAVEKLPVAPVVDPPEIAANSGTNTGNTPPKRDIVQPRPPKREASPPPPAKTVNHTPKKTTTSKPPKKSTSRSATHKVVRGDNLYRISKKYGVSQTALQRANGITDPSKIHIGQVLKIPR